MGDSLFHPWIPYLDLLRPRHNPQFCTTANPCHSFRASQLWLQSRLEETLHSSGTCLMKSHDMFGGKENTKRGTFRDTLRMLWKYWVS